MSSPTVEQFANLIRERTGNVVPEERFALLEEVAERRARALSYPDVPTYLKALSSGLLAGEWDGLISLITIKESYFFRAPQQFEALRREILPRLLAARSAARRLRFWSAACARGEEPSTLAILCAEEPALAGWQWSILATDVDEEALEGARRGLYGERAVSQVPPELLARHFTRRGKLYELDPKLRSTIDYQALNLAQSPLNLPEGEFDLILLRNVLIYFKRPLQRRVVGQVAERLAAEGYMFLGASETLWQIEVELDPVDLGGCFCYRHATSPRPARVVLPIPVPVPRVPARRPEPSPVAPTPVRGVSPRPAKSKPPTTPTTPAAAPPPPSAEERLTAAALLLAENRVAEAADAIKALLVADPGEPAVHALQGFLHDLSGRAEEAVTAYRAALYLDPSLFQPRLLLADCLLRLGHTDLAEKQFKEVMTRVSGGHHRTLTALAALPLPDGERALRRCRQALQRA